MNLEEVQLLIKQLGKELYEDNPERQSRGPFSVDKYKGPLSKEEKLADVRAYQAEMADKEAYRDSLMDLEDALLEASPSLGEKLIQNFINLYPMGKRGSTGISSLIGKGIGEMTEAEAAKIAEAESKIVRYNQMQQEGEPLNPMQLKEQAEAEGILSALPKAGTPDSRERYFESLHESGQLPTSPPILEDFIEYQESKGRIQMAPGLFMTRAEFEALMDEDYSDIENLSKAEQDLIMEYNLELEDLPKGPPKELKSEDQILKELGDFARKLIEEQEKGLKGGGPVDKPLYDDQRMI